MQRMISIPLQSTSTINIHVPLGDVIAQQQQQQQQQNGYPGNHTHQNGYPGHHTQQNGYAGSRHHVTRMSVTSNGSSVVSVSPPSTPRHHQLSRSSSRNSPPASPDKHLQHLQQHVNGIVIKDETFETDSAVGSSQDDSRSVHSTSSERGSETSSASAGADVRNNNSATAGGDGDDESGHCAVALFVDKRLAVLVKVGGAYSFIVTNTSSVQIIAMTAPLKY